MQANLISDKYLVEKAQAGNSEAFDALIRRYQKKAYLYAYRLTRDRDLAADVVATAFVRIHRAIGSFKAQSTFSTWIYRIVTNCFFDLKKRGEVRPVQRLESVSEDENGEFREMQIPDHNASPFDECVRRDKNEAISEALDELTYYQKAILTMFHVEMLSYEEIAVALGIPIGTVKSRLNRSRRVLAGVVAGHRSLFVESDRETIAA